jgi:transposase
LTGEAQRQSQRRQVRRWRGHVLTDNGAAFRSKEFAAACEALAIQHKFTRPYRPQTNGKAERFIQSALREWAYGWTYQNSAQRTQALASWQHHYNWHRPHSGIGSIAPTDRLIPANNLLTVHSQRTFDVDAGSCGTRHRWYRRGHFCRTDAGPCPAGAVARPFRRSSTATR